MNFVKKTAFLIVFVFSFLCTMYYVLGTSRAQEFNFEKAYQDYIFTQTVYDQAYTAYKEAKNSYLKNPTLTLKEDARKKTHVMLVARDELIRVYLATIRIKLIETKVAVPGDLDSEIEWYKNHKDDYKDSDPLTELFIKSKQAQERHKSNTLKAAYGSLFNITLGEFIDIRTGHEEIYKTTKDKLDKNVSEGKLKVDPFDKWLTDINLVIQNLRDNEEKAKLEINKMYSQNYTSPITAYNSAVEPFISSISYLISLNNYLTEFSNSLSNQLK